MKSILLFVTLSLTSSLSIADDATFETCREKLKKAQKIDLLYDLDWKKGSLPKVTVGPTFFTIPFDAKEGFAETLNCFFMAGDTGKCIDFDLLNWKTGNRAAKWSSCKLKVF